MESEIYQKVGWIARGDFQVSKENKRRSFLPRLKHAFSVLSVFFRYLYYGFLAWWRGRGYFMNIFPATQNPYYGVPCGGIGCGGIGRDFRGGFCKFSLLPGIVEKSVSAIEADQFLLTVKRANDSVCIYQKVLSCAIKYPKKMKFWDFSFPAENIHYRGLYPRSWTLYEIPELQLKLLCKQLSPVLPNDYTDTSLPVCLFIWCIENNSKETYDVSITFTFCNGTGDTSHAKTECRSQIFESKECTGIKLCHSLKNLKLRYGVAAKNVERNVIKCTAFNPKDGGRSLWAALSGKGNFDDSHLNSDGHDSLVVATSVAFKTESQQMHEAEFVLVWDMPIITFATGKRAYKRRYTRFFHNEVGDCCEELCKYAFASRTSWESRIEDWQSKYVQDDNLPNWYKSALFNDLYFMTDGGSCWVEYDEQWRIDETLMSELSSKHFAEFGRFAYLEAWDYLMMNTYDVHFYSSFAFVANWPELELSIQYDFADELMSEDERLKSDIYKGAVTQVKKRGRIPHDLGNPTDEPWLCTNTYMLSDTSGWKDLNLKFILACYRDYVLLIKPKPIDEDKKKTVIQRFYDLCSVIATDAINWDVDDDGMIENDGADQTYDMWSMHGTSAYCGGLWIAALESCRRMAEELGRQEEAREYAGRLERARVAYEKKLWNGEYFDFDEHSEHRNTIMADQLCGLWYMSTIDGEVKEQLMDKEKVTKSLSKIFNMNVKRFAGGCLGPVNGMRPDGKVDLSSLQSEEVWGGTAYALASFFVIMGEQVKGFETAEGWYRSCWEKSGLQYQVPEALCETTYYRANGYMRPLDVWAIQWALNMKK